MAYILRKADFDRDGEVITTFWQNNFPAWPLQKFQWFYLENPHGPADCWLLSDQASGSVVGCQSVFPRLVYCDGKPLLAGIIGDLGVARQHRSLGPALQLQKAAAASCQEGRYAFLYGYPNQHSEVITRRIGFRVVGKSLRLVRVLRSEPYLARKLKSPFLAKIAGMAIDWAIPILARETRVKITREFQPVLLERSDERFDDLFGKAQKQQRMIGDRSHAFLSWRFTNCPFRQYMIYGLQRSGDGSLAGYVVYHQQDEVIHIWDLLAESRQILERALLPAFLRHARKSGNASVSMTYTGQRDLRDALGGFHFRPRPSIRNVVALSGEKERLHQLIQLPEHWYFLAADNDG